MELDEVVLSVILLVLAGSMATVSFAARREYLDPRFVAVGLGLVLLSVVGATSLFSALFPDAEPAVDIGIVPLALLVLVAVMLNLPVFLRFPQSRRRDHD